MRKERILMAPTVVNRGSRHENSRELSTTERLKKIWIEEGIQQGVRFFAMRLQHCCGR